MSLGWILDMGAGPIYLQIGHNVRRFVARGELAPGSRLPSARSLAETLEVNPNTVIHAYQDLERSGVIETRRGRGTFVCAQAPVEEMKRQMVQQAASVFVREVRGLGVARRESLRAVEEVWDAGGA